MSDTDTEQARIEQAMLESRRQALFLAADYYRAGLLKPATPAWLIAYTLGYRPTPEDTEEMRKATE